MSDFCSDPIQFTLQLTPKDQETRTAAVYYLSCEGQNPSYSYIYDADYSIRWLNYLVQEIATTECDNPSLKSASADFYKITDYHVVEIENFASCHSYAELWTNFVDDAACTDTFGGVYIVWIAQTVTAICLFICTVVGIRLIPLLEKIDQEKVRLLDDESYSSKEKEDLFDSSSHHSIEFTHTIRRPNTVT